jgi:hypothetical protein
MWNINKSPEIQLAELGAFPLIQGTVSNLHSIKGQHKGQHRSVHYGGDAR